MGRAELIGSLRSKAAEDVEALWRDTRARADAYRAELAKLREQRRADQASAEAAVARKLADDAVANARHDARALRARAALALAERLHRLALEELPRIGSEGGEALFLALADELPPGNWGLVRVRSADASLAQQRFPQATIVCDEKLAGGLEAEAEGGRIRITNSLETRLATAWPDILPELVTGLLPESNEQRTPS